MAKKNADNVVALEIEKYESKISEFQNYLAINNFQISEDKYKEADLHIKLMTALPNWILALKSMKEDAQTKTVELRGGGEISDGVRIMKERTKNEFN